MGFSPRGLLGGIGARLGLNSRDHALDHLLDGGWLATAAVEGGFAPVAVDGALDGRTVGKVAARLHWVDPSPDGKLAIAVARRPGPLATVFDPHSRRVVASFTPAAGRVFSGHGRFTEDGASFQVVEIDATTGEGIVSVRSVAGGFDTVNEWASAGSRPHDLLRAGASLVVANGGVEPFSTEAFGEEEAGSSVALLDPATGETKSVTTLGDDLTSLSLRHLAVGDDGLAVVAAQDLLQDAIARPLVYGLDALGRLTPFDAPDAEWRNFRSYIGSVAIDASGAYVAAASPRGNRVVLWRRDGRFIGVVPLVDGCGLSATREAGQFIATSGLGDALLIATDGVDVGVVARRSGGPRYDNHVAMLG